MKRLSAGVHTVIRAIETYKTRAEINEWVAHMKSIGYSFTKEAREYIKTI